MSKPAAASGGSVVTLRPNETVDANLGGGNNPWLTSGLNHHSVVADDSDLSFDYALGGSNEGELDDPGSLVLGFGTSDLSGAASIDSVTIRIRARVDGGGGEVQWASRTGTTNNAFNNQAPTASYVTYTGTARTTKPGGGAWDQTAIDGLRVILDPVLGFDFGQTLYIAEVWADVAYTP